MEKIGLGYEEVKKINPKIIYASISGFGHTGPEKFRPGYDLVVQGMSGIMSLTGTPEDQPWKVGTSIGDILAGIYTCQGILLALIAREKTGCGQRVDISMLDGAGFTINISGRYLFCNRYFTGKKGKPSSYNMSL